MHGTSTTQAYRVPSSSLAGGAVAALLTLVLFYPALSNQFVAFDDLAYVVDNRRIDALDWHTLVWAFTRFHEANWHPLTMLSLALDRQLWGLDPWGFHLTSIVLHSGTVFLATLLFASLLDAVSRTGRPQDERGVCPERRSILWGSIGGALFFGLHPLRVESVAWVSERKDVLCLFFIVATLVRYVRHHQVPVADQRQPRRVPGAVVLLACLAFMSKPTSVCLPLLMLLLDWYPLQRIADFRMLFDRVREKAHLFLAAAGVAVLTLFAQQEAMAQVPDATVPSRLLVACKAVFMYLWHTVWPVRLAPLYLHPGNVVQKGGGEYAIYAFGLVAISASAWLLRRRYPFWTALWLYYLLTLAPVLGIVQVGGQWLANRYSYLPSLGIALLWGGGGMWLVTGIRHRWSAVAAGVVVVAAVGQLALNSILTLRQIQVWRTTETLATRQIELLPHESGAAYLARAAYREQEGNYEGALADLDDALAIAERKGLHRKLSALHFRRATVLSRSGRLTEALAAVDRAVAHSSGAAEAEEYLRFRREVLGRLAGPGAEK